MSLDDAHARPTGTSEATVSALGKLSEALEVVEVVEDASGQLDNYHRKCAMADLALGEAEDLLRDAGHEELAERLSTDLVGRNILAGRWSFQVVEGGDPSRRRPRLTH